MCLRGIRGQGRLRSACTSPQSDQGIFYQLRESLDTVKPILKATCIKPLFQVPEKEDKCKFTCIKQAPVLSNHFLAFPKVLA